MNQSLKNDLILLLENKKWDFIRLFFSSWKDEEELVDKVLLWGHFFLSHYFKDESPVFHRELIKAFFSGKNEYNAAPRGFSKTTIEQLCISFSVVNKIDTFIVVVEKTFREASEVIRAIHAEFVDNPKILQVYGNLLIQEKKEGVGLDSLEEKEAQGDIFINGVRIRGKGFNTSIRGLKSRQYRPSKILLDDVEEDEHINNPEQRKKYRDNFDKGIQPAVDIDGTIKMQGTILHQDSLLNSLINQHNGRIYKAYDRNDPEGTLLWPSRWSFERLEAKKQDMTRDGKSSNAFYQEYLNEPIAEEERKFKWEWLWEMIPIPDRPESSYQVPAQRITMEDFDSLRKKTIMNGYAQLDMADTTTENADFTGVIVEFVAMNGNRYRVDVRREKRNINGVIDLIFEIWEAWHKKGLIKIGIEKKGFEDQILPLFNQAKLARQIYPVIEELKPMGRSKENRILGSLQGLYEHGKIVSVGKEINKIFVPVGQTNDLLNELYDFPSSKNDDLSDAEAYQSDIVVIPMEDERRPVKHQNPQDDPFEDAVSNLQANYNDPDPFE